MRRLNPWLIVLFVLALFLMFSQAPMSGRASVSYNEFKDLLAQGKIERVVVQESQAQVTLKEPTRVDVSGAPTPREVRSFSVRLPGNQATPDAGLIQQLQAQGVNYRFEAPSQWWGILSTFLPIILLFGMMYFFFMRAQGGQNGVMQFGQSRAKKYGKENRVQTKFTDVAGHEEAKRELIEVVDFLKNPGKYHQIGAEIPKGVLLVGPPGTGKTLLARAVAGEADVPFFSVSASEFMEMFVGVGASRVRTLFEDARKSAPAIIFIDEIDSIGRKRGAGIGGGHDEREQTLNQILSEMDGFDKTSSVIVLAATNRPDVLDPALLRPGRFDRQVTIDLPNLKEREAILKVHLRNKPLAPGVDVPEIARSTPYFSGADLKNLTNEAALEAARLGKTQIDMSDFYRALDKITLGLENSSLTISPEEKKAIAYHEAGHAITAAVIPGSDKLQKVSIIPRGRALGAAFYLPEEQVLMSKERLENQLVVSLGGRAAEEVFMGTVTSGAADDFRKATNIARKMVLEWGMGENFKNMALTTDSGPVFLGEDMAKPKAFSEHTAQLVDEDVKRILYRAYERARSLVTEYAQAMHEVAEALLSQELITGDVVREAVARVGGNQNPQTLPQPTA
ncbi:MULTISPECIES: ATP-dependent zinc metalloprotease FtsH [Deinococcus]|uniref:ATP-dependent zinc metalloprotease FtsH n=1 Tax=Deinococcus geothermalis (strain DSM 11300 / CIP 105573 / AG-3a) TaxID=319795 RepID=Q1IWA8_DEIGD|nr:MULTISPECIES: ATP-dependent zinc metalloprotease FtsH [Deinococcus]ABF46476.1 membrane protease FtsH catalytic subunit [Deinococcus geothermalis DSM 11300]MBI0444969.1 ATP-dependent metallopeptidase FtsH/Yme1/Tma family protein [Deinococcus sp. DB0503]